MKRSDKEHARRYRWLLKTIETEGFSFFDGISDLDAVVVRVMANERAQRKHAREFQGPKLPDYAWGTPEYRALELARFNAANERGEVKYGRGL